MQRREFLRRGAGALVAVGAGACLRRPGFRVVPPERPSPVERAAVADASALLARAFGEPGGVDVVVGSLASLPPLSAAERPSSRAAGAYRVRGERGRVVVAGADAEGARNGLYRFLEHLGFGLFRDGETLPAPDAAFDLGLDLDEAPRFRWRGDMIWDNYLGPKRYCAAMWDEAEWERALLFMARSRMNFLEFYPPLERALARAFPEAAGLDDGAVWKARVKHELAKRVLARGRELGIHFMYVLTYGAFPPPVRALYPNLEWRNGFLCAHQPELREMTERLWAALVEELGTDHWYAIRHRGEEEQSYGDPCRSVTKAEGFLQAFSVLERVDAAATPTVWTWGETLPDLFERFPENVRAVHVRHGMANVFGDRGEGREQRDGRPELPRGRRWLSAQFTVFSGNEVSLQTAWSDAAALARDAGACAADERCEGFFQWPEWSDTSAWLSHVVARLGWDPESLGEVEARFEDYARRRHGERAGSFVEAFGPLLRDGNARWMYPPRKRLVVPFVLAPEQLRLLANVRAGAEAMLENLSGAGPLFRRDLLDALAWVGLRQAQALEAEAVASGDAAPLDRAEATWVSLAATLALDPDRSVLDAARGLARVGALSTRAEDSLWELAFDFYSGYPLVPSPEAIELVYLPQLAALRAAIRSGEGLEAPGWFWHDFPERAWAESMKKLPSVDGEALERETRARIRSALSAGPAATAGRESWDVSPARRLLAIELPRSRSV